jgi:hypothetical protein
MRARHFATAALALALAAPAAARQANLDLSSWSEADRARFTKYCETHACRRNVDVSVRKAGGGSARIRNAIMPPAIQSKFINVLPGERIEAVVEIKDGQFIGWRAPKPGDGDKVHRITVEFQQNKDDAGMLATIRHSGPTRIKLDLGIVRVDGSQQPEHTSSCPLMAEGSDQESWPYPMFQLFVGDARELDDKAQVACE